MNTALKRTREVCKAIRRMAESYPRQALEILRVCGGTCRLIHLAQAVPEQEWPETLSKTFHEEVLFTLDYVVGARLSAQARQQAQLPNDAGGLGLIHPDDVRSAARLSMLLNAGEDILRLRNDPQQLQCDIGQAVQDFHRQKGQVNALAVPKPQRYLQKVLTAQITEYRKALFVETLTLSDRERLLSIQTPHAMSWIQGQNPWISMTASHFRAALKWTLGVACIPEGSRCKTCGVDCDIYGLHVSKCTRAGAPARGHTVPKDVFSRICREAGKNVLREQPLKQRPDLIPADLLISYLKPGCPTALDFTCWSRLPVTYNDVLDQAMANKGRYYKQACENEGWTYLVWAADTYGGMHPRARTITSQVIKELAVTERYGDGPTTSALVWRAMSTAVVMRAAVEISKYAPLNPNLEELEPEDSEDKMDVVSGTENPLQPDHVCQAQPASPSFQPPMGDGVPEQPLMECSTAPPTPESTRTPAKPKQAEAESAEMDRDDQTPIRVLCTPARSGPPPYGPAAGDLALARDLCC